MKPIHILALLTALLFFVPRPSLFAEDWTTTYGRVYHNVTVLKTEPDAVTILHHDGGALVPLEFLPADLQKRFNYDPLKAQAYSDARAKSDAASAAALQTEIAQAKKLQAAQDAKYKADQKAAAAGVHDDLTNYYSGAKQFTLGDPNNYPDGTLGHQKDDTRPHYTRQNALSNNPH